MLIKSKLSSIISTFTKLQEQLTDFIESNGESIKKAESALSTQRTEQAKAEHIKKSIDKLVGDDEPNQ